MTIAQTIYQHIKEEIRKLRRADKRVRLLHAFLVYLFYGSILLGVIVFLNALFPLSQLARTLILIALSIIGIIAAGIYLLPKLLEWIFRAGFPSDNEVALRLGKKSPFLGDRLANALQLYANKKKFISQYSDALIDQAMENAAKAWQKPSINSFVNINLLYMAGKKVIAFAIIMTLMITTAPSFWQRGWIRTFYPSVILGQEENARFTIKPGNITIAKGEPIVIKAFDHSAQSKRLFLHMLKQGEERKQEMVPSPTDTFYYHIAAVRESFGYFVSNNKSKSAFYNVELIEFPALRYLQVKLFPPSYTHQDTISLEQNIGDLEALKGTMVIWSGQTNKHIHKGELTFASGHRIALERGGLNVRAIFKLVADDTYTYKLVDEDGLQSNNPITYHIKIIADHYPFVRIVSPGQDVDLDDSMILPLLIQAQDDYGFSQIKLAYQVLSNPEMPIDSSKFQYISLPIPDGKNEQIQIAFQWDLSSSPLLPNEVLVYNVIVFDNDEISGPKQSKTEYYRARFPTIYELYQQISKAQEEALAQYDQAYKQNKEIQRNMENLSLQLKRMKELSWQKRQEIEENIKKQEELQQLVENAARQLDEMIKKSEQHRLFSSETLQKFEELQQLYREIMTPELQAALEKVKEAMQNIDENLIQRAIDDFKQSEMALNSSLERTISLLKRLKQQQAIEQAIRLSEDIRDRQQKLCESFQNNNRDIGKSLKEQEALEQNAKELENLLENLAQEAARDSLLRMQELFEAADIMKTANLPQRMRQNMNEIQTNSCKGVEQISQDIQNTLQQVSAKLQKARDTLSGVAQKRAMQAIRAGINNLLTLSFDQEALLEETRNVSATSAKMQDLAERQKNLLSALERVTDGLYEAAKETFAIKSNVSTALGQAQRHMNSALEAFENRDAMAATSGQGQAMAKMNETVKQLFSSLQSMMRGGKGGGMGMDQFIQQLQNLAASQQGINSGTAQLGQGEQFSLAQQAAIARLAQQQQAVRKTLEELIKEAREAMNPLGDMGKIIEDMKDVEKDLWNANIKRETIEKQNQILSRLLDAPKSIREREYSNKRKAETGKEYLSISPPELAKDMGERRDRLQQDLLRAKKEGYTRDYLEIIKEYFEAITSHELR